MLLLLVGAVVLFNTLLATALTPYLPELAREFDLSKGDAGLVAGAYAAGILVAAVPGGLLGPFIGAKRCVLLGLGLMTVSTVAFALAPTVWMLELARFAQGVSVAVSWPSALAWLVGEAPRRRRAELLGLISRGAIIGVLLGPVLGAAAGLAGRAPAFTAVGLLGVVLVAWTSTLSAPPRGGHQAVSALFAALTEPRVAAGLWLGTLTAISFGVLSVLAPLALDRVGWSTLGVGAVFLVAAAVQATASPAIGRVADRRGRLVPVRAGLVITITVTAAIPWIDAPWPLAVLVVAATISFGLFWIPGMALLTDGADTVSLYYGLGFMLMNLAWASGQFAGAAAGGALAETMGDALPFLLLAALSLVTLLAVQAGPVRRRAGRREGEHAPVACSIDGPG